MPLDARMMNTTFEGKLNSQLKGRGLDMSLLRPESTIAILNLWRRLESESMNRTPSHSDSRNLASPIREGKKEGRELNHQWQRK